MRLPTFRRNPSCPKCGHDGIHFEYVGNQSSKSTCGYLNTEHRNEHIHLKCARCSFGESGKWIMAVAENPSRTVGFRTSADSTGVGSE